MGMKAKYFNSKIDYHSLRKIKGANQAYSECDKWDQIADLEYMLNCERSNMNRANYHSIRQKEIRLEKLKQHKWTKNGIFDSFNNEDDFVTENNSGSRRSSKKMNNFSYREPINSLKNSRIADQMRRCKRPSSSFKDINMHTYNHNIKSLEFKHEDEAEEDSLFEDADDESPLVKKKSPPRKLEIVKKQDPVNMMINKPAPPMQSTVSKMKIAEYLQTINHPYQK
jgi:hypothetical protein